MALAKDDNVLHELATTVPDPAFCGSVLPWAAIRNANRLCAHGSYELDHLRAEDRVAVEEEISRRGVVRESFAQLLDHPCRCRMECCVEVHDVATTRLDDEEAVQQPERRGRHGKQIHGHDVVFMVAQESHPSLQLVGLGRPPRQVARHRVIVSDLERARPIWVGGEGRKETDIDLFFKALGGKKSARIKLAAMDMWKPFRNSVIHNAPNARIIFDKFHIMRHLSKALDEVRRGEYKRLSGKDRSYIKGQRYTLLSRRENLSLDGRRALKKLLQANRRLNTAYILKEAFGQLWDYRTERGARAFFTRWKDSLKWQRLHPYQKFAGMIESHWDGIASYCHPENKVSLGLVEGVNNKIRVLQRRAYGYRDEEYLKLKIVAAFLPPLPRNAVFNPHESA